eukprot:g16707.t1
MLHYRYTKSSSAFRNLSIDDLHSEIKSLIQAFSVSYQKYPLLCVRQAPPALEEEAKKTAGESNEDVVQEKAKKKKGKPTMSKRKLELMQRRGMIAAKAKRQRAGGEEAEAADSDGEEEEEEEEAEEGGCKRAVAVVYNRKTHTVRWGLSGKLRKQKVHSSIWGKSLLQGRPRGTCAEFRTINEALLEDETVEDMVLFVADVLSHRPKPRCRNCLCISASATCLSDDLCYDGDGRKLARFQRSLPAPKRDSQV